MIVDRESLPDTSVPPNERAKEERQKRKKGGKKKKKKKKEKRISRALICQCSLASSDSSSASLQSAPLLPCNNLGRNLLNQAIRASSN